MTAFLNPYPSSSKTYYPWIIYRWYATCTQACHPTSCKLQNCKIMLIIFFMVITTNEVIISHVVSIELCLVIILSHTMEAQCRHLYAIKMHLQPKNMLSRCPCHSCTPMTRPCNTLPSFQDHTVTAPPLQDDKTINNIKVSKSTFLTW